MKFDRVYHGTVGIYEDSILNKIDLSKSQLYVDFGKGFYVTSSFKQAEEFSRQRTEKYNRFQKKLKYRYEKYNAKYSEPIVIEFTLNKDVLSSFKGIILDDIHLWKEFVCNNRLKKQYVLSDFHNHDCIYDYVYGAVADSGIAVKMLEVEKGIISANDLMKNLTSHKSDQLSFHTDKSLEAIKVSRIYKKGWYYNDL